MQFGRRGERRAVERGIIGAVIEPRVVGVIDLDGVFVHQPLENEIHRVDHLPPRSEIHRQLDPFAIAPRGIFVVLFHEERRIGKAEAINRLLDVADHEQIIVARNRLHNRLLHGVGVLILVNHHGAVLSTELRADIFIVEDFERQMLHIVEVDDATLALGGGVRLGEIDCHVDECLNRRSHRAEVFYQLFGRRKKIFLLQSFDAFFISVVAQRFYLRLRRRVEPARKGHKNFFAIDGVVKMLPIDLK